MFREIYTVYQKTMEGEGEGSMGDKTRSFWTSRSLEGREEYKGTNVHDKEDGPCEREGRCKQTDLLRMGRGRYVRKQELREDKV